MGDWVWDAISSYWIFDEWQVAGSLLCRQIIWVANNGCCLEQELGIIIAASVAVCRWARNTGKQPGSLRFTSHIMGNIALYYLAPPTLTKSAA